MEKFKTIDKVLGILNFILITIMLNIFFAFAATIVYLLFFLIPEPKKYGWF